MVDLLCLKLCKRCNEEKPVSLFGMHRHTADGLRTYCNPCAAELAQEWRRRNPEKNRASQIRHNVYRSNRYATDAEWRAAMLAEKKRYWQGLPQDEKKKRGYRNHLRTAYDMSHDEYCEMVWAQSGVCACCGREPKKFVVDHDHATGCVRGLLCSACNNGIGMLGDTGESLQKAVAYLG